MLLAAVLLQASIAAPTFAPPTDTPLRIVTDRSETAAEVRHYRLQRLARFSLEGSGYRAEVIIIGSTSDAPQGLGNLVERGLATLEGRSIVFHLDDRGRVTAIDDMVTLWERVCRGVADAAAQPPTPPSAEKLAATLRALPAERQRSLLATLVTAMIASEPLDPVGATMPVRLPGASPFGAPVTLEGTRHTVAAGNGMLRTTTIASATLSLPSGSDAAAATPGSVSIERTRTFDPRTGMIASGLNTTRNVTGSGASARETLLVTRLRVERAAPSEWTN